jgi:hypothetical protein
VLCCLVACLALPCFSLACFALCFLLGSSCVVVWSCHACHSCHPLPTPTHEFRCMLAGENRDPTRPTNPHLGWRRASRGRGSWRRRRRQRGGGQDPPRLRLSPSLDPHPCVQGCTSTSSSTTTFAITRPSPLRSRMHQHHQLVTECVVLLMC